DLALHLIQRHHAGLSDPRAHATDDLKAAAALRRHVERGLHRENRAQGANIGDRIARGLIGFELTMLPGFRYLRHHDGDAPRILLLCHATLAHALASACSGDGNLKVPANRAASLSTRNSCTPR